MRSCLFLLLVGASLVDASQHQQTDHSVGAIQKVITMLTDMLAKGKSEKQEETVRFASFKQFCESTAGEKQRNIASSKEAIEQLTASIAKAEADAQEATKYIAGLDADVDTWTSDLKTAREERAKEKAAFEEAHAEYLSSIDAVARAHKVLKAGPGEAGFTQVSKNMYALLQTNRQHMSKHAQRMLVSFLQKIDPGKALLQEAEDEGIAVQGPVNPEAAAFEGSSGGIIDMIERLGDKFDDERIELEKREANSLSAFQQMESDLVHQIDTAGMERGMKEKTKATRLEDAAAAKGDKADTTASLAEDEKFLADLNAECEQKSFDYQARQTVRQGEIEAIGKAIEIMSSEDVTGGHKHLGLVRRAVSLAQLRSTSNNELQEAAANFLKQKASETNSRILSVLAIKAASDPFVKVKKMIQDMITKLNEDANADATHEGFCDTEMGTNKQTRERKASEAEELSADIEEYTAAVSKLASEITELGQELSDLDGAVAEATTQRNEEKAKNHATLSDATTAAEATARALAVLKEFYEKAATPIEQPAPQQGPIAWDSRSLQILENAKGGASLLQIDATTQGRVPGAPEMEEGQYSGMANGGVLGLMEVVQSDFEKVIAETDASEADAAKAYDSFMADSSQDKAVKETDQKHKMSAKQAKESDLATAKKDLRITQDELHAAMQYYEKLKPDCESKALSYAEKVAQRKAEIDSLEEALQILSGENI